MNVLVLAYDVELLCRLAVTCNAKQSLPSKFSSKSVAKKRTESNQSEHPSGKAKVKTRLSVASFSQNWGHYCLTTFFELSWKTVYNLSALRFIFNSCVYFVVFTTCFIFFHLSILFSKLYISNILTRNKDEAWREITMLKYKRN